MTNVSGWRRFLTCATIDILLVVAAGSAIAAPAAHRAAVAQPVLPTLLLLGIGLCGLPWRRWTGD
ncbi:MAG TPA: hypothetical protein VME47_24375 [Acetobacteraceae bacterium]|nr:hypothetical protein [Acetobacteraceae bacterium]